MEMEPPAKRAKVEPVSKDKVIKLLEGQVRLVELLLKEKDARLKEKKESRSRALKQVDALQAELALARAAPRSFNASYASFAVFGAGARQKRGPAPCFGVLKLLARAPSKASGAAAAFNDAVARFNKKFVVAASASEAVVQKKFMRAAGAAAELLRKHGVPLPLQFVDTHTYATVNKAKPDVCVVCSGPRVGRVMASEIVVLGELTAGGGDFTDADFGQLLSVMIDLGTIQGRAAEGGDFAVFGFLCNVARFCLHEVVLHRGESGHCRLVSCFAHAPIPVAEGAQQLVKLLMTEPADLKYDLPEIVLPTSRVSTSAYLGRGATSHGYLAAYEDAGSDVQGVAKVFTGDEGHALSAARRELAVMHVIATAARNTGVDLQRVVRLAVDDLLRDNHGRPALLLAPFGARRFAVFAHTQDTSLLASQGYERPTAAEFCDLLDALAQLHACGFTHRDPRPENFFRDRNGNFILGDLGMAAPAGTGYTWETGVSLRYGPLAAIEYATSDARTLRHPPVHGAAEDYEQVARCVFAVVYGLAIPFGEKAEGDMLRVWQQVESCTLLVKLLAAAKAAGDAVAACTAAADDMAKSLVPAEGDSDSDSVSSSSHSDDDGEDYVEERGSAGEGKLPLSSEAVAALKAFKAVICSEYPLDLGIALR